jgi:hypothetical protein
MARPRSLTVIALLALVQGILGALVGLVWLQISNIFDQEGGAMSSLIGTMAEARGWSRIALSLLYLLFAVGAWQTRAWAWWIGLVVPVLTILLLVDVLLKGGSVVLVFVWLIVPFIMAWYLLSPTGRQVFTR